MAGESNIEWCSHTWNPIVGCTIVSPGCTNCYAMRMAGTRLDREGGPAHYRGTTQTSKAGPVWTGKVALAPEATLLAPLRWRKPAVIFVNSMGDLFHESIPDEAIDRVFAVMSLSPQHTFQCLTKRAERMQAYVDDDDRHYKIAVALGNMLDGDWIWNKGKQYRKRIETMLSALHGIEYVGEEELPDGSHTLGDEQQINPPWPLPNVWLGISAERQQEADERIPHLLATPAAIRFVSLEPLLGPIDVRRWLRRFGPCETCDDPDGGWCCDKPEHSEITRLDWTIVGGESGPNARPMHPDWARSLRDQCAVAGVAFFFKQFGEWASAFRNNMGAGDMVFKQFATFTQWVNKANTWVNGGICLDTNGLELKNGAAFMKARDEGRFPVTIMHRVGKKAAGRLLDGVEHNGMPHTPTTEPIHPRPAGGNTDYLAHHPRDG